MDFEAVNKLVLKQMVQRNLRLGIIGGFALHAAGYTRATQDIDFLAHHEDMPVIKKLLLDVGYECGHESQDVVNFWGKLDALGGIDFIIAHRKYALAMLERAQIREIFPGCKLKVVIPEDIIGLKLQALHNDPARKFQDLADIQWLMTRYKEKLDKNLLKEYFQLFNDEKLFEDLWNLSC